MAMTIKYTKIVTACVSRNNNSNKIKQKRKKENMKKINEKPISQNQ